MFKSLSLAAIVLFATSAIAADPNPKDDVKTAAKALADKPNYSWKTTIDGGAASPRSGTTQGKGEKGGFIVLAIERSMDMSKVDAVGKGDKMAIKTDTGWQTLTELSGDMGGGANLFTVIMLTNYRAPAAEAEHLADQVKELKKADDVISGDLTEAGAKEVLAFRFPGAMDPPAITNAKGSAKFWLKDGALVKYEFKIEGSIDFNGNAIDINRTTTVEIKDVGTTKVEAPEDAKKKLQ